MIASTAVWAIWAPKVGPTDELVNSDWSTPKRSSRASWTRVTSSGRRLPVEIWMMFDPSSGSSTDCTSASP